MSVSPQVPSTVVHSVTTVSSRREDTDARLRRYLWTMGIRIACFLGLFFVQGWLRWALAIGAVVLPWIAVVAANARRPYVPGQLEAVGLESNRHLHAPATGTQESPHEPPVFVPPVPLTGPGEPER